MSHEPIDARAKPLWIGLAITLAACLVGVAATLWLLHEGRAHLRARPATPGWYRQPPIEVNEVEAAPFVHPTDAERGAELAQRRLRSYGWVDRTAQRVHVPIDVAFDIYLRAREEQP
jgi:hypothetical protein